MRSTPLIAVLAPAVALAAPGDLDPSFMTNVGTGFSEPLNTVAVQSDGTLLVGGSLGSIKGAGSDILWELNADGTLAMAVSGFATAVGDPEVNDVLVMSDGKVLVGGVFDTFGGVARGGDPAPECRSDAGHEFRPQRLERDAALRQ